MASRPTHEMNMIEPTQKKWGFQQQNMDGIWVNIWLIYG